MEPGIPCRKCWYCKNGRYNNCPDIVFSATPPHDGSMVECMAWPADFLFKIPDSMSFREGAHFVFETVGNEVTIRQAVEIARDGGTVDLVGLPPQLEIKMPIVECVIRELHFLTSFRYCYIFEEAITLMAHGKVNLKPMLTHEFAFDDTLEAFNISKNQKDRAVKVMINI
jgi:threonine dehydrogenase-like Zn-dependent dehydrogenase